MANFNLQDYEPVQERIGKFYAKYPEGRIITDLTDSSNGVFVFKATLYKSGEDLAAGVILSTGWAREIDGKGYVNQTSALENCETSAIGRALANIGLHGDKRPSREEMQKVNAESKQESSKQQKLTEKENIIKTICAYKTVADLEKYKAGVKGMITRGNVKLSKPDLDEIGKAFSDREFELSGGTANASN